MVTSIFSFSHNVFNILTYFTLFFASTLNFWVGLKKKEKHGMDVYHYLSLVLGDYSTRRKCVFSSTGRRPASLCHGPLSVVRPSVSASVRVLTFSLNIFFSETTCRILMKFHRNVPAMVLFEIF